MDQDILQRKIAKLESLYDQLQSEMNYLDSLLKEVGFEEGLKTLKEAALEHPQANGEMSYLVTDAVSRFCRIGQIFLGDTIHAQQVRLIDV